jgi:hypothetical protein
MPVANSRPPRFHVTLTDYRLKTPLRARLATSNRCRAALHPSTTTAAECHPAARKVPCCATRCLTKGVPEPAGSIARHAASVELRSRSASENRDAQTAL